MTEENIQNAIKRIKRELRDAERCLESAGRSDVANQYIGKIDAYRVTLSILNKAMEG